MSDEYRLPQQLNFHADRSAENGAHATVVFCRQAADTIARLTTERDRFREALQTITTITAPQSAYAWHSCRRQIHKCATAALKEAEE